MSVGAWVWVADALAERLGSPILDTQKMVAFALSDGRQIAVQKDVEAARIWVEHDNTTGWPPATIIRKYAAGEGRPSSLPPRLSHVTPPSRSRKLLVLSVAGPRMLEGVLSWYGAGQKPSEQALIRAAGTVADDKVERVAAAVEVEDAQRVTHVDSEDATELTLGQLVEEVDASVRLTNCVRRSQLRHMTVRAARAKPEELVEICMAVPSMGRKTINELQELLDDLPAERNASASNPSQAQPSPIAGSEVLLRIVEQVRRVFGNLTVEWLVRSRGGSVRLVNGISSPPFKDMTLGDLLADWRELTPELYRMKNLGRKSVSELRQVCVDTASSLLETRNLAHEQASNLLLMVFQESGAITNSASEALSKIEDIEPFRFDDLKSRDVTVLHDIVQALSELLDERARDIVDRRFGLRGLREETLEEIAQGYIVTRERIRQVEAKALKKMIAAADHFPLRDALANEFCKLWSRLSEHKGYVTLRDFAIASLPPELELGLRLADSQVSDILDMVSTRWRAGWHRFDQSSDELGVICQRLGDHLGGLELPRPMPSNLDDASQMVINLGLGLDHLNGYLLSSAGTRKSQTRLIELHRAVGNPRVPVAILALANRAAALWNEPSVSARYLSLILSRFPHLFIEAAGDNWFAVGLPCLDAPHPHDELEEQLFTFAESPDPQTMAGFLYSLLEEAGPLRLSALMERAASGLPGKRSLSSVGPTLIMHKELFERYLPGVYGLAGQEPDNRSIVDAPPSYLLNEEQARLFALGRRAGVTWGTFPLWTPAAEFALCGWALESGTDDILESLLSTASIDLWPVGNGEKVFWKDHLARSGCVFGLHFAPREQVGYALPALDRLLAACLEARASGTFNWITANLVLNRTVGSSVAAGLMALMCSLDALVCDGEHWQLPHRAGPKLEEVIELLSRQLHDHGSVHWQSGTGAAVLASAADALTRPHPWLDRNLLAVMLDEAEAADTADARHDFESQMVEAAIDELLWEEEDVASPAVAEARNALEAGYAAIRISAARVLSDGEADWSLGGLDDEEALG